MHWTTILKFILSASMLKPGTGITLTPCPLEARENTQTVFTCSGLASTDKVTWSKIQGTTVTNVGDCPPLPATCNSRLDMMLLSRSSADISTMTIMSSIRMAFGGATISCEAQSGSDKCQMDVIYPADVPSCNITSVRSDTTWTVSGSCTISKAFSSKGDYFCQLRLQKQGTSGDIATGGKTPYTPTSSGDYASGTCSYSASLPVNSATYTYTVVVSPGDISKPAGSITVAAPSEGPTIKCRHSGGQYIPENTALDCTCTAYDFGQPEGRLVGYHDNTLLLRGQYGASSLTLPTVTASRQKGQVTVRCVVDWATGDTQDKSDTFTVPVAYGPDTVTLNDPGVFDLHPTLPDTMTLTCSASASNPAVTYSWSRSCDRVTSGSTCRFTPTVSDHNTSITCTVTNTATQVTRTASRTITLNWPPPKAPSLSGYSGQALYSGQFLIITCALDGGNPGVSNVTISCGNRTSAVSGQTSTAHIQVDASFNGDTCSCVGSWKLPTWYTQTGHTVAIVVYYAPKTPSITYPNQPFPFMAGETPTLRCQLPGNTDQGNPPATLTLMWPHQQGQQGEGVVTLILGPVTAADNGLRIQCEASNAFTVNNNTRVVTEVNISVYYSPDVRVSPLPENQCQFRSTSNTCIVSEGQRVYANCTADSNPAVASITWTQSGDNILDFTANRTTDVTQQCTASTKSVAGDPRLPLHSSLDLSVLVKYRPTSVEISLNSRSGQLVVNESQKQDVEFVCRADGRPTPNLRLVADFRRDVAMVTGSAVGDTKTLLRHTLSAVRGEDSANYSCLATNDLGQKASDSVALHVRCQPKVKPESFSKYRDGLPYINYRGSQTKVTFDLLAYPVPEKVSYLHLGLDLAAQSGLPQRLGIFGLWCRNTSQLYMFTCDVIADDITSVDVGFYNVTLENEMGRLTITILVDLYGVETTDTTEDPRFDAQHKDGADAALSFRAGIGVGIAVGVVCTVGVGAVTVVLWRRKIRMSNNTGSATPPVTSMSSPEAMTEPAKEPGDYSDSVSAGPYEALRLEDVGQRSLYEDLHKQTGVR